LCNCPSPVDRGPNSENELNDYLHPRIRYAFSGSVSSQRDQTLIKLPPDFTRSLMLRARLPPYNAVFLGRPLGRGFGMSASFRGRSTASDSGQVLCLPTTSHHHSVTVRPPDSQSSTKSSMAFPQLMSMRRSNVSRNA